MLRLLSQLIEQALAYWGLIALLFAAVGWLTGDVGYGAIAGFSGLALLWLLLWAPNPCGAATRVGKSCRNNARGILRGCHLQQHKWQRMRTFFVRPRLKNCVRQLFATPVTGLASLVGIATLVSTLTSTILSALPNK